MCERETVRGLAEDFSLAYCLFCLVIIISTICQGAYDKQETEQCCQEEMQDERKHNRATSRRWGRGGMGNEAVAACWRVCLTCVCLRVTARMCRSMHLRMSVFVRVRAARWAQRGLFIAAPSPVSAVFTSRREAAWEPLQTELRLAMLCHSISRRAGFLHPVSQPTWPLTA